MLIPHWIEHNAEHGEEFRIWAEKGGAAKADLLEASRQMELVNHALQAALDKLGGALEENHIHHHHND
ncbi:MAG: hypothetical protein ACPL7A_00740 [Anaerolineales bacterium]